jgi:hypothetical protein
MTRGNYSSMTWVAAFGNILSGECERAAGATVRWRQLFLCGAFTLTAVLPIVLYQQSRPYQGKLPPEASTIQINGRLIVGERRQGLKQMSYAEIRSVQGETYVLQEQNGLEPVLDFMRHSAEPIHIEGFVLRDGAGRFFPLKIETPEGRILVEKRSQMRSLTISREPFGGIFLWMLTLISPLWAISFVNVAKLKITGN